MSETPEFPENYGGFLAKAEYFAAQNEWAEALRAYLKAYHEEQSFPLNVTIVKLLIQQKDFETALSYAGEYEGDYQDIKHGLSQLYQWLLFENYHFLTAAIWYLQSHETLDENFQQMFDKTMAQMPEDMQNEIFKRNKSYRYLGALPPLDQVNWLRDERVFLPPDIFIRYSKQNLLDESVHPLVKTEILHHLTLLKVTDGEMFWLDEGLRKFDLGVLTILEKSPTLLALQEIIADDYEQKDPMFAAALQEEMYVEVGMLFPFEADVIQNPVEWLQAQQKNLLGETLTDEEKVSLKWQSKIQKFLSELT